MVVLHFRRVSRSVHLNLHQSDKYLTSILLGSIVFHPLTFHNCIKFHVMQCVRICVTSVVGKRKIKSLFQYPRLYFTANILPVPFCCLISFLICFKTSRTSRARKSARFKLPRQSPCPPPPPLLLLPVLPT